MLCILFLLPSGCAKKGLKRFQAEFLTLFDTVTIIVGYAENKEEFTALAEQIYDEFETYHRLFDIYNDYEGLSNIKTINDNAGTAPVKVDGRIISLLKMAKEQYAKTGGAVNVAFGAVLGIWHDYREAGVSDPEHAELPPMEQLRSASGHTDIDKLIIDEEALTVYLSDPLMRLDVGAVAKGYAVEMTARHFESLGVRNLLLSVGGNVRAIGGKPADKDGPEPLWIIGIQNPDKSSAEAELLQVAVNGLSVVSSGAYERYYTVDNTRYHHIIDHNTLMPSRFYSAVTVICPDSGVADALSTAVFNMPLPEGRAFIESLDNTEVLWVLTDGTIQYTSGFEAYIFSA